MTDSEGKVFKQTTYLNTLNPEWLMNQLMLMKGVLNQYSWQMNYADHQSKKLLHKLDCKLKEIEEAITGKGAQNYPYSI